MKAKQHQVEPVDIEYVKRLAHIVGPQSAAQKALDDLARRRAAGEEADIYLTRDHTGHSFIVGRVETR